MIPTLLTLLVIQPSHALSCLEASLSPLSPAADSADVPLNAVPTFSMLSYQDVASRIDAGDYRFRLIDDAGDTIDTELITVDDVGSHTFSLAPADGLAPQTGYTVEWSTDGGESWSESSSFTTGLSEDDTPPSHPTPGTLSQTEETSEWGLWAQLSVAVDVESTDSSDIWYRVELSGDEDFSDPVVRGAPADQIVFYDNPCESDAAALLDPETSWVRLTAIDAAGNESDTVVGEAADPDGGTGCASLGTLQLDALALSLGLVGLLWRTRRSDETDTPGQETTR